METLPDHQREIMSLSSQLYIRSRRSHVSRLHHKYTLHRVLRQELYRRLYRDHLCAFRCLAVHQGHFHDRLETHTKTLFSRWIGYLSVKDRDIDLDPKSFRGVQLTDIPDFEKCFNVNVNIYQLRDGDVALSIFKSICRYKDILHLNLFENHLSYIYNLPEYTKKYQCATCDRHFPRLDNMKRHQKICKGQTKYRFPGGFYSTPKTIFDKLEQHGIVVPEEDRLFEWFLVYDFEAILQKSIEPSSDKLK